MPFVPGGRVLKECDSPTPPGTHSDPAFGPRNTGKWVYFALCNLQDVNRWRPPTLFHGFENRGELPHHPAVPDDAISPQLRRFRRQLLGHVHHVVQMACRVHAPGPWRTAPARLALGGPDHRPERACLASACPTHQSARHRPGTAQWPAWSRATGAAGDERAGGRRPRTPRGSRPAAAPAARRGAIRADRHSRRS
jgi:hypothetical protein